MRTTAGFLLATAAAAVAPASTAAFQSAPTGRAFVVPAPSSSALSMAKKKKGGGGGRGFGSNSDEGDPTLPVTEYDSAADVVTPASSNGEEDSPLIQLNAGQQALEAMRSQRRAKKDEELRAMRAMMEADSQVKEEAAAIPEKVAQRMGRRMLPFVGLPLFGGMGAFVAFWYLATYRGMEFQPAVVATTTVAMLAVGLLGITYSVMSASWDPDTDGSALGVEEFNKNLDEIKGGLQRSRKNLVLREKMASLPSDEIDRALDDLDRREAKRERVAEDFGKRMEREME